MMVLVAGASLLIEAGNLLGKRAAPISCLRPTFNERRTCAARPTGRWASSAATSTNRQQQRAGVVYSPGDHHLPDLPGAAGSASACWNGWNGHPARAARRRIIAGAFVAHLPWRNYTGLAFRRHLRKTQVQSAGAGARSPPRWRWAKRPGADGLVEEGAAGHAACCCSCPIRTRSAARSRSTAAQVLSTDTPGLDPDVVYFDGGEAVKGTGSRAAPGRRLFRQVKVLDAQIR